MGHDLELVLIEDPVEASQLVYDLRVVAGLILQINTYRQDTTKKYTQTDAK